MTYGISARTEATLRRFPLTLRSPGACRARGRRALGAAGLGAALVSGILVVGAAGAAPAAADTAPAAGLPTTVSADALPTWQLNGVVWSSVTVGNNVYVTGNFSKARPPGTAAGSSKEIAAGNLFAFDVRTGNPLPDFEHSLNGQGLAVSASPDGKAIYVGGDFTEVDGRSAKRLVSFSVKTGALRKAFAPAVSGTVRTVSATNDTVYVGGSFASISGGSRAKLGAVDTSDGALTSWAPTADAAVTSMVVAPNGKVVVGGHFTELNGSKAFGMGALDANTGASLTWKANQQVIAGGANGAVTSLRTDGKLIYGGAYTYASKDSRFEGTFAVDPADGNTVWANDCHGDNYDVVPLGRVLYTAGHAHDCAPIGAFPDTKPRSWHRALAFDTQTSGKKNKGPDAFGWDYSAYDHSNLLQWYPEITDGTFTGQAQAAWSVTGNATYVVLGGEFPKVNGVGQHSLTRFAIATAAPNKSGPVATAAELAPTVAAEGGGKVKVTWPLTWDYDNRKLTYSVLRDSSTKPFMALADSTVFWHPGTLDVADVKLPVGSTHTYRVQVTDPFGNTVTSAPSAPVAVQ